jgi:hypothetical protein
MYRKYLFIIISLPKKYSSRDTIPLKSEKKKGHDFSSMSSLEGCNEMSTRNTLRTDVNEKQ